MLDAALGYAERGFAVFPVHSVFNGRCTCGKPNCTSPGKHPLHTGGYRLATSDTDQIRAWWNVQPFANVAIATGAVSGVFVLDVDVGAKGGLASLRQLEDQYGPLDKSMSVRTGSGGWHFYFEMPERDFTISAGVLGQGLDIRANRGHVVAPPSIHVSGNEYRWEEFQ